MVIGILSLQGDVREHREMLERLGCSVKEVRNPDDFSVDALVLPGGESTTMTKLMADYGLHQKLLEFIRSGKPVFGTCAGAILLAKLGVTDMTVVRNAYGRQRESFEATLDSNLGTLPAVFIRAPIIESCNGEILARHNDKPVMVRDKNVLVATFHPELTNSTKVHEYFLGMMG